MNVARTVTYPGYIFEILNHAGLFHERIEVDAIESALDRLKILVTIGEWEFPDSLKQRLSDWVDNGGAWLSIAGMCGMENVLGAVWRKPEMWTWAGGVRSLGEGYFVPLDTQHPALASVNRPVHLFGGVTVIANGAAVLARVDDKHGRPTDRPGLLECRTGAGYAMLLTANLSGTIVRIQQGVGVHRDGVPAADGSAPIDDLVLKSDDGAVLDWDLDRDPVPGMSNFKAFLEPAADVWREIFLRCIFYLATQRNIALPMLWLYPRKLPALAHISHDSDSNEPEKAEDLLQLLAQAKIHTTWCIILPGYDAELTDKINDAGHELATHYDALSDGAEWSQAEWKRQYRLLSEQFGHAPVTNKNHATRWEGDCEFWHWCAEFGIQLDQSKAPAKPASAASTSAPVTFISPSLTAAKQSTASNSAPVCGTCIFSPPSKYLSRSSPASYATMAFFISSTTPITPFDRKLPIHY
jgi:hypothetical protein